MGDTDDTKVHGVPPKSMQGNTGSLDEEQARQPTSATLWDYIERELAGCANDEAEVDKPMKVVDVDAEVAGKAKGKGRKAKAKAAKRPTVIDVNADDEVHE